LDSSDEDVDVAAKRPLSESEAISKRKERKRLRKDKLIKQLDRKKARLKEDEAEKKARSVFEAQERKRAENGRGRPWTVSLALPGSILANAQGGELRAYLAGQVARAAAVFNVDEVVVFDDQGGREDGQHDKSCLLLARILQYLECPQYLRKNFFPLHPDLKHAGVLNPTDMPHHLRDGEVGAGHYREGVVLDRPPKKGSGSLVYVGLKREAVLDRKLEAGTRVTVRLDLNEEEGKSNKPIRGKAVSPSQPRTEMGLYWGYRVRLASTLSAVFSGCPFDGGYDLTVGTSERGQAVDGTRLPKPFSHMLVVFGGVQGLEVALEADPDLTGGDPAPLFDLYLNTCPLQGSRTIRTEEAVLVTMSSLRPKINEIQSS